VRHPAVARPSHFVLLRTLQRVAAGLMAGSALWLSCAALAQPSSAVRPAPCAGLVAEEVLLRLNAARLQGASCHAADAHLSAPPLRWSSSLTVIAATQSGEMAALNRMVHRDRLDRALDARLVAGGYRFGRALENIAVGYPSLEEVVSAWLASDVHCANLMDGAMLEAGLACSDAEGPHGDRYWTLVLSAPPRHR
jgi:uncharacterized protein YkwD